ncbi:MAG TPA: hypothetical protein PKD76_01770 [Solirubrobacterales bacterium]|nr:hypothetical protein [Solirubrobacterales bacterium]
MFETGAGQGSDDEKVGELYRKIGELTVERDFLDSGLARFDRK